MGRKGTERDALSIVTPALALISALGVAVIGVLGNIQLGDIRSETSAAKTEVEKLSVGVKAEQVALEQQRFDAEQQVRKDGIIMECVPKLLSADSTERDVALATLFVLYPNEANDILFRVAESLGHEQGEALKPAIRQAETLDVRVGSWAVVSASTSTLEEAQLEVGRAEDEGYTPVVIYKRGEWFGTTVGDFPSQEEAASAKIAIRSKIREGAYVVNLQSWCPNPTAKEGYYQCQAQ